MISRRSLLQRAVAGMAFTALARMPFVGPKVGATSMEPVRHKVTTLFCGHAFEAEWYDENIEPEEPVYGTVKDA